MTKLTAPLLLVLLLSGCGRPDSPPPEPYRRTASPVNLVCSVEVGNAIYHYNPIISSERSVDVSCSMEVGGTITQSDSTTYGPNNNMGDNARCVLGSSVLFTYEDDNATVRLWSGTTFSTYTMSCN